MADAFLRVEAGRDPEILNFTSVAADATDAEAREWIAAANKDAADSTSAFFVIADAETDVGLGSMGLIKVERDQYRAEIGYWLLAGYRGKGHATRALEALMRWSVSAGFHRLQLIVNLDNDLSIRLALKQGFRGEGILRSYGFARSGREDVKMYGYVAPGHEAANVIR
jgi:RimJ/RimL family protein N-acetyltransferase